MRYLCLFLGAISLYGQTMIDGRPSVVLESTTAQVVIDLRGGSIVKFELKAVPVNPLGWNNQGPATESRPMSHFLCTDRWGQPSTAEEKNGMPYHGEATRVEWKLLRATQDEAEMSALLPMANMEVVRTAKLTGAILQVTESITNRNKLGRPYNFVQHPTIAAPFLDETTLVDANAKRGLMQSSALPNPEQPEVVWPQALLDGQPVNLRHLHNDPLPAVVSYVVDEAVGWVTAVHPGRGLVLGYLWQTSDYPWLNIWRHVQNGKPFARGLEFGTTGLHQPFPVLVKKGRIFDRPLLDFLDAGETHTRRYTAFLGQLPAGSTGVQKVAWRAKENGNEIVITEREANRETVVR
jgi:hypothetical protein